MSAIAEVTTMNGTTVESYNITESVNTTTAAMINSHDSFPMYKVISSIVAVVVILIFCAIGYLLYRKICRSHVDKHGVERTENGTTPKKGRREYIDQFGCDTNDLTVNSVTAILSDREFRKPWASGLNGSKSSGIDCDFNLSSDDSKEVQKINTGKRVFQVNKVPERSPIATQPGQVKIRLHRGLADAASSLQAADGRNYTLAIIDKNSKTIHNIDLRNYRARNRGRSPLAGTEALKPSRVAITTGGRRRRLHSCGDTKSTLGTQSASEMIHDSPDFRRKVSGTQSAEEYIKQSSASLTDMSDTTSDEKNRERSHSSLSSRGADEIESTTRLLAPPHPGR